MMYRGVFVASAAFAAMTLTAGAVNASALLYRDAATGRWVQMAAQNNVKGFGAFAAAAYKSFSTKAKAPIVTACGKTLAVFSVELNALPPNTAIVLYDATTGTSRDVAVEGAAAPAPLGGTYGSFKGVNPALTIHGGSCVAHVVFRASGVGAPAGSDTGIVERTYTVPLLAASPASVLVQEGSAAPFQFPVGSTFGEFPVSLPISAATDLSPNLSIAFRGQVTGGGVTSMDDTGVFVRFNQPVPPIAAVAREGDPSCPPGWAGAGPVFDDFPETLAVGVNGFFGPIVAYRAKSKGGSGDTDTAIVTDIFGGPCGLPTTNAVEGSATPAGGTYWDFGPTTPLVYSLSGIAFLAKIAGGPGPSGLFTGPITGPATTIVQLNAVAGTALGSGVVKFPPDPLGAINSAASPSIVFSANVAGYSPTGLFLWNSATVPSAELLTFRGRNAQIDAAGHMTVRVP